MKITVTAVLNQQVGGLPVNTAAPTISGTETVGETLTATGGTWTGSPTPPSTWQWLRDGVDISGATATTYLLVAADEGTVITVEETVTNAAGSATQVSAGTGLIAAAGGGGTVTYGGVAVFSTSTAQTVTVALPTGYSVGSLLVVQFSPKNVSAMTHTMSAGWTQVGTTIQQSAATDISQSIWYKFAASTTETAPVGDNGVGHACYATSMYFDGVASVTAVTSAGGAAASTYAGTAATGMTVGSMAVGLAATANDNALGLLSGSEQGFTLSHGGAAYDSTARSDASIAGAYKSLTATSQQFPTFEQTIFGPDAWAYHELELVAS